MYALNAKKKKLKRVNINTRGKEGLRSSLYLLI